MNAVLICSATLVFTPILLVQYQRWSRTYTASTPNSRTTPTPSQNPLLSSCTAKIFLFRKRSSSNILSLNSSTFSTSSNCPSSNCPSRNCPSINCSPKSQSYRHTTFWNDRLADENDGSMYHGADSRTSVIWRGGESSQLDGGGNVGSRGDSDGEDDYRQERRNGDGDGIKNREGRKDSRNLHKSEIEDGSGKKHPVGHDSWPDKDFGNHGEHIDSRRGSRKPWHPPFPTRARTVGNPAYRVLPNIGSISDRDSGDRKLDAEAERGRRSTSGISPPVQESEDALASLGHLPVTEPLSYGLPLRSPSPVAASSPSIGHSTAEVLSHDGNDEREHVCTSPHIPTTTRERTSSISIVQTIVLILAFIIFIFVFAMLVAHCLAWFLVYKTEARLGELRKGLLRGGDMRVCLCAR